MTREMTKGGPTEAIKVCAELAPEIAGRPSREHGWRVTHVGTRVRNPLLGMPDAWEQKVSAEFAERTGKGEAFPSMTLSEVVTEPGGQWYRFMKPIAVQPQCRLCHGPSEQIPEEIRTVLKNQYPFDAATGYKSGELRGSAGFCRAGLGSHCDVRPPDALSRREPSRKRGLWPGRLADHRAFAL